MIYSNEEKEKVIKVLHVATGISHSSAPLRIHKAIKQSGIDSRILALNNSVEDEAIGTCKVGLAYKVKNKINYFWENKELKKYPNKKKLPFSFGMEGIDISKHSDVLWADVIHLHWINAQFLSVKEVAALGKLNKPIVWTFHDSWPMTGGCHVRYGCTRFITGCGKCPELQSQDENDITSWICKKKLEYYPTDKITIVTPSKWMQSNVEKSAIFSKSDIKQIGNPLDLEIYKPYNKETWQKSEINILFGASGAMIEYKGYRYFVEAMKCLWRNHNEIARKIKITIFGTAQIVFPELDEYECTSLGYIQGDKEMAKMYSDADIYVFPSLDDNLPGTVMECMACETAVIGFDTCGVPELIHHKESGYVARFKDAYDLAEGIVWIVNNNTNNILGKQAREYVKNDFEQKMIGKKYFDLYKELGFKKD